MTSIRNLPLAVRLGGAFGAFCLAMAVVAFTGLHAMSGLRAKADTLAERHLRAAELLGQMRERSKDDISTVAQHLYVHDGDLATEDKLMGEIENHRTKSDADGAELERLFAGTPAADEYAAFVAKRNEMARAEKQVLAASRAETLRNADDRSGSRDMYENQLIKLDDELEASAENLATATNTFAAAGVQEAHAADASGQHRILLITVLAA